MVYDIGLKIHNRTISMKNGLKQLLGEFNVSESSAKIMFNNITLLLFGKTPKRAMNIFTCDYFLSRIQKDFPKDVFFAAEVKSAKNHVDHYESKHQNSKLVSLCHLLDNFSTEKRP